MAYVIILQTINNRIMSSFKIIILNDTSVEYFYDNE